MAVADFNGDGLPDIAVAAADELRVTVLLNQPEGLQFNLSALTSVTAGTPFQATVTAVNKYGRTYQGYQGRIHFTSTDGTALLPADATLTKGLGTFTVTLKTAGSQNLTITDTAQASVQGSMTTTVAPAAASRFT